MRRTFSHTGCALRDIRDREKLSQGMIARLVGVNIQAVSNWERGVCMPPLRCLPRLVKVMHLCREDRIKLTESLYRDACANIKREYRSLL